MRVWDQPCQTSMNGEPPTVVLLHGWTSTAALNWFRCFGPLSSVFRVVAPDLRGHGRGIRSRRPFRLEDCADDVAALAGVLGVGPVVVAGYSMGGPVAQLVWRRHPEVVRGLVLCATSYRFAKRSNMAGPLGMATFGLSLGLTLVPEGVRRDGMARLLRNRSAAGYAPWALAEWESNDPAALLQAGVALGKYDASDWIGEIDVPTAVVVTALDETVSPRRQRRLAERIPRAELFEVQGDHRACVNAAREFVPALQAACAAVAGGQPSARSTARAASTTAGA